MWTTADGYTLRISETRLGRLVPRFARPGLSELVNDTAGGGDARRAVSRTIGRLARNAFRSGALRSRRTGRRYAVFSSHAGGRAYTLLARPDGPGQVSLVTVRRAAQSGEYSDSHGHQLAQTALVNSLIRRGLQLQMDDGVDTSPRLIRENRRQLNARGKDFADQMPDISYVSSRNNMRVNVEIDTDPDQRAAHMRAQIKNDPDAYMVAVVIDPYTGEILQRQVYDPARHKKDLQRQLANPNSLPGEADPNPRQTQLKRLPPPHKYSRRKPPPPPDVDFDASAQQRRQTPRRPGVRQPTRTAPPFRPQPPPAQRPPAQRPAPAQQQRSRQARPRTIRGIPVPPARPQSPPRQLRPQVQPPRPPRPANPFGGATARGRVTRRPTRRPPPRGGSREFEWEGEWESYY